MRGKTVTDITPQILANTKRASLHNGQGEASGLWSPKERMVPTWVNGRVRPRRYMYEERNGHAATSKRGQPKVPLTTLECPQEQTRRAVVDRSCLGAPEREREKNIPSDSPKERGDD